MTAADSNQRPPSPRLLLNLSDLRLPDGWSIVWLPYHAMRLSVRPQTGDWIVYRYSDWNWFKDRISGMASDSLSDILWDRYGEKTSIEHLPYWRVGQAIVTDDGLRATDGRCEYAREQLQDFAGNPIPACWLATPDMRLRSGGGRSSFRAYITAVIRRPREKTGWGNDSVWR